MTIAAIDRAPTAVPTELARGRGGGGPAPKRVVVAYGFWIFILSDMVMFSALFAAYAVLSGNTAGGPTGAELFNLHSVFIETMCLLLSSYTCGLGALSAERRQPALLLDLRSHSHSCSVRLSCSSRSRNLPTWWRRAPARRAAAFCPRFFTLVGTHGVHVTSGLDRAHLSDGPGDRQGPASRRAAAPVVLEPVLARAGHRLGRGIHAGLSDGRFSIDGRSRARCSTTGRRASKSMNPRPAICRTRWGWGSRSWRRSPLSSCRKPVCSGPRASRSG